MSSAPARIVERVDVSAFLAYHRRTQHGQKLNRERWQSGRMRRTRNPVLPQGNREFESHPLRHTKRSATTDRFVWLILECRHAGSSLGGALICKYIGDDVTNRFNMVHL